MKSVGIAEQFKIGRGNVAVDLAVLGPLARAALVGDEQMWRSAEQ